MSNAPTGLHCPRCKGNMTAHCPRLCAWYLCRDPRCPVERYDTRHRRLLLRDHTVVAVAGDGA